MLIISFIGAFTSIIVIGVLLLAVTLGSWGFLSLTFLSGPLFLTLVLDLAVDVFISSRF